MIQCASQALTMPIPDHQTLMLPLLKVAGDGQEHRTSDVADRLARDFKLTEEERQQLLPSGKQATLSNRVAWAKTRRPILCKPDYSRQPSAPISELLSAGGRFSPKARRVSTTSIFLNSRVRSVPRAQPPVRTACIFRCNSNHRCVGSETNSG
jgi:restriction endonuclease Mrr